MQLTNWQKLRMRAYLAAVGLYRRMTLGVRVMVIEDNRVLLVRQGYVPGWHLPGGGVEPGETAQAAAQRELLEETGLAPTELLTLVGLFHNVGPVTRRDHVALYRCGGATRLRPFKASFEVTAMEWFAIDALPADTVDPVARRIAELRNGAPPDQTW